MRYKELLLLSFLIVSSRARPQESGSVDCKDLPDYQCVAKSSCDDDVEEEIFGTPSVKKGICLLGVRGSEDENIVCCKKDKIKAISSPEDDAQKDCNLIAGHRCVAKNVCDTSEDEIFNSNTAIRGVCTDPRSVQNGMVCCKEDKIKENSPNQDCNLLDDHSCVAKSLCEDTEADIFGSSPAVKAVCAGPKSDEDTIVCCHKENIKSIEVRKCEDLSTQGYMCIDQDDCEAGAAPRSQNTLGKRSEIIDQDNSPTCQSSDKVCCHHTKVKESFAKEAAEPEVCLEHAKDGYQCVPSSNCLGMPTDDPLGSATCFGKRQALDPDVCCHQNYVKKECSSYEVNGYKCIQEDECNQDSPIGPRKTLISEEAESSKCALDGQVCCHKDNIDSGQECLEFSSQGYKCLGLDECIDSIINDDSKTSEATQASCPVDSSGFERVCCKTKKFAEEVSGQNNCEDNTGYFCSDLSQCNAQAPVLKSSDDQLVKSNSSGFFLNNAISMCQKDYQICCQSSNGIVKTTPKGPTKFKAVSNACGRHYPDGHPSYIQPLSQQDGEFSTKLGEWPHACLIFKKNNLGSDEFVGGASLIAPGIIVTAAHKVDTIETSKLKVRCGDWDLIAETEAHQDREVESVSIHPRFNDDRRKLYFDVALLHMKEEFELTEFLNTICLPDIPNERENNYDPSKCVVMGWGKDRYGEGGSFQVAMKQVLLSIVDNPSCQKNLRDNTRLKSNWVLNQSFLCAGGEEGKDACDGDGGGSLVCKHYAQQETYVLAGVVAWGIKCGQKDVPGVYASITDTLCFIQQATTCKHGDKYDGFYKLEQCDGWIDREIEELEKIPGETAADYLKKTIELKTCTM